MVYINQIFVDGACRENGDPYATAAAAAVHVLKVGRYTRKTQRLDAWSHPRPTNQRAEITAMILGLQLALEKYELLMEEPRLEVTIKSDSKYAVNTMNEWIYKWTANGWTNPRGEEVMNRDLREEASELDDKLKALGNVKYVWVPRLENSLADGYCNQELDGWSLNAITIWSP